ncbi:14773_t:CDS:2 [Cetraspora pellucida]|uniref:14773_t:CDS:1 n=1 Tax=Cetraspora pellucida TaxID=1433469 RepID=A0A9N9ER89_9GLOM|nr:14773_t:CDS:2 [Cetraspora pellucida]
MNLNFISQLETNDVTMMYFDKILTVSAISAISAMLAISAVNHASTEFSSQNNSCLTYINASISSPKI